MTAHFYDRTAGHFANYSAEQLRELRASVEPPNLEETFTRLVEESLRPDDRVLDIGTGDGLWFGQYVAPRVSLAVGLDDGEVRLRQGLAAARQQDRTAPQLIMADARRIPFPDRSMSVIVNRRGPFGDPNDPRFLAEGLRVLAASGRVFEIGIGEFNCREISQVFGRSQMMAEEDRGRIVDRVAAVRRANGLWVEHVEDNPTFEYFPNRESLELRLLTAPILDHFDPVGEAHLLNEVVRRNTTPRGIRLTFHRTILVSSKTV